MYIFVVISALLKKKYITPPRYKMVRGGVALCRTSLAVLILLAVLAVATLHEPPPKQHDLRLAGGDNAGDVMATLPFLASEAFHATYFERWPLLIRADTPWERLLDLQQIFNEE